MSDLTRIMRSEWRKIRSIPTMWWLLAGTVLLSGVGAVGGMMVSNLSSQELNSGVGLQNALHAVGAGSILVEIAAIIGMAGEFRFGQADQTFLSSPRRQRVVNA